MKTNPIADLQVSLHYLTTLVEAMQKTEKEHNTPSLTFEPDIAMIIHACVVSKRDFKVKYADGEFDCIDICFDKTHIMVHADRTMYERCGCAGYICGCEGIRTLKFDEVMKRIVEV